MRRRKFITTAAIGAAGLVGARNATATDDEAASLETQSLAPGGADYSPATGEKRTAVPSACWQCVSCCPIVGYLENGRLVKIEGHPESLSTRGRLCPRGQAGVNQVYDPDRVLHPLKRTGARGEGEWERITWDEALSLLVDGGEVAGRRVKGLAQLRDEGTPEKFLFHYGRTVGSDATILFNHFLPAYGTDSVGDHHSICIAAGGIASQLTGGSRFRDLEKARIVLNFGASVIEANFSHTAMARRYVDALAGGLKMYTFDVRLSDTAAASTEWIPVKPATDIAVLLALSHVVLKERLHDEETGVPAGKIRSIAIEFAENKPGMCIGMRGSFMHYNGVQTQRAIFMLQAIVGNVDTSGRRGAWPRWNYPFSPPSGDSKSLDIFSGEKDAYAMPNYNVSHQILNMIDKGPERPDVYMVYCHNPVYSNGDCRENERVFKDEEKIPFLVSVDVAMSETTRLADLVLPDATYLERWTCHGTGSPEGIPEYYIRQPMHAPLGEARNFCDVACEISGRMGLDLGFQSAEDFVKAACESTSAVRRAGGFEYMKEHGLYADKRAMPGYSPPRSANIKSQALADAGFDAIPSWMPVPWHENLASNELILTTFKVALQSHSRTQNCKWLTELYHDNPAWIHPRTAAALGIEHGDEIELSSDVGRIVTRAHVTHGVHPDAIAISNHGGHWAYGRYASGEESATHAPDGDTRHKWWDHNGAHVNIVIPNRGDPIAGSMCWNDTVVRVKKT
jgi:anaerobic selenocysteine-containing dehydrogenase